MNDRSEFYRRELRKELSIGELVNLLHSIFEDLLEADGCSVMIEEDEKYYLASEKKKMILDKNEKSLAFKALNEKKTIISKNVSEDPRYNDSIDNVDDEAITSELFFPLPGDLNVVVNIWKNMEEEKEEVMTPLIVGNQIVSVSTTKKSKIKLKEFDDDDLKKIESIQSFIKDSVKKIHERLPGERDSFAPADKSSELSKMDTIERDFSLSELRRDLEYSLLHVEELEKNSNDLDVSTLERSVNTLLGSRRQIFEKLRSFLSKASDEISSIVKPMDLFETELQKRKSDLCLKNLEFYIYIDPSIRSTVELKKNSVAFFLGRLLDFCIDDADFQGGMEISLLPREGSLECRISYDKKICSDTLLRLYRTYFETRDHYLFVKGSGLDEELVLAYAGFQGKGYSANVDYRNSQLIFSFVVPYLPVSQRSIGNIDGIDEIRVGILFDREKEYRSANLLARYLVHMGLDRNRIVASNNFETFDADNLTHLIIYQSMLSPDLFEFLSREEMKDTKVLLFIKDCRDEEMELFDFSSIDFHLSEDEIYLSHLLYFFGSNLE